jgi:hypothetical protein
VATTRIVKSAKCEGFTPAHLLRSHQEVEIGAACLIVGFPLGFCDEAHHLPVVRHPVVRARGGQDQ